MQASKRVSQEYGKARQLLAAIIVNLLCLSYGISVGWVSPTIPQLSSSEPPIGDTPLNENQISWLSSLLAIGAFVTIPFCGILTERIGRKNFALLAALPLVASWLLVIFAVNHICLFAARLLVGVSGAMTFFIVPLYASEIASENIRGVLGTLLLFSLSIGIVIAYAAGAYLPYQLFARLSLVLPVVFLAAFALMPESPVYLVRRNLQLRAHKSLMFLRGNNQVLVEQEIAKLRSRADASDGSSNSIKWSCLLTDRATRRGLMISIGLITGQQLSGIFAMISYTETIFKLTGSSLSSDVASITIGCFQIVGAFASTILMDRAGRRLLTLISCCGMAISHAILGLFFYLQLGRRDVSSISWLPVVALSTYIVAYCSGIGPVPFVVTSEIFRSSVSSFASNVCFVFYWAITFASIQTFDRAMLLLGADGCFFMLASFCAATWIFAYYLLPETKGREREDIIDELAGGSCRDQIHAI